MVEPNSINLEIKFKGRNFDSSDFINKALRIFLPISICVVQGGTKHTAHIRFEQIQLEELSIQEWAKHLEPLITAQYNLTVLYMNPATQNVQHLKYSQGELVSYQYENLTSFKNSLPATLL